MGIIDDLKTAVENYETDNCATEIVSYALGPGGGTVLNVGETFQFKIRVTNRGHLDMKGVKVRALGTSFADVAYGIGPFAGYAISGPFDLAAHQSYTTDFFRGKAKAVTNGAKDIVSARIDAWDASFSHILLDHTGSGVAEGRLNKDIQID